MPRNVIHLQTTPGSYGGQPAVEVVTVVHSLSYNAAVSVSRLTVDSSPGAAAEAREMAEDLLSTLKSIQV